MTLQKQNIVRLGSASAQPGQKAWGQLLVRGGGRQVKLAVCVVNGAAPGEHVVLLANQHGGEVNGFEAIRRFCEELDPKELRGTLFAIPSANPLAAMAMQPTWPERKLRKGEENYRNPFNMNFNWTGKKGNSLVAQTTYAIWSRAIMASHRKASLVVDVHCHQARTAVYARDKLVADLGVVAGIRNIVITGGEGKIQTCNTLCVKNNIMGMTIELHRQAAFDEESIGTGQRAFRNLLRFWGMLDGKLELPPEAIILNPWRNDLTKGSFATPSHFTYYSNHPGFVVPRKAQYDLARKGDVICEIIDPHTGQVVEQCRAPWNGAMYMVRFYEVACKKGDRIFTISIVKRVKPSEYVEKLRPERYKNLSA